ncbi:head decoration protein [Brevibacillus sp. B_LB10_24]|uniref:head decoration protein n=1 Tax=Brevibacillus sp. B_LB10_24 TaxID=3380645 RepID=UPI0038B835DC
MPDFGTVENRTLFAGTEIPAMTSSVTVLAGQGVLKTGSILGKVTADGKYKLVNKASADGSQVASVVLAEDLDTTGADQVAVVYTSGLFNADSLSVAAGDTVEAHKEELRDGNIYIKTDY